VRPVRNLKALVRGLALAAGLDELNGTHSQAEVARELGCTRALMSHYVTMWADLLGVHVLKFRKAPGCRATYSKAAFAAWKKRKGTEQTISAAGSQSRGPRIHPAADSINAIGEARADSATSPKPPTQ
jgi:hypothetical protein